MLIVVNISQFFEKLYNIFYESIRKFHSLLAVLLHKDLEIYLIKNVIELNFNLKINEMLTKIENGEDQ